MKMTDKTTGEELGTEKVKAIVNASMRAPQFCDLTRQEYAIIDKIVDRGLAMINKGVANSRIDRMTLELDIHAAHTHIPLDLEKLLTFDDFNFIHDVGGIIRHMDRRTAKIGGFFVPRAAIVTPWALVLHGGHTSGQRPRTKLAWVEHDFENGDIRARVMRGDGKIVKTARKFPRHAVFKRWSDKPSQADMRRAKLAIAAN